VETNSAKTSDIGKIIFINGTSSAGKTTLARRLQKAIKEPFCYYASDQLADGGFRAPLEFDEEPNERERFFDGFHRSIVAFAMAGNNLIVEHIVEQRRWHSQLLDLLRPFDTFWVGLRAPLHVLESREIVRGDREVGEAKHHLATHDYCRYDLVLDGTDAVDSNVVKLLAAWHARPPLM